MTTLRREVQTLWDGWGCSGGVGGLQGGHSDGVTGADDGGERGCCTATSWFR